MKVFRPFLLIGILLWCLSLPAQAQTQAYVMAYGDMRQGFFEVGSPVHHWTFTGSTRDILRVTVQRIGGQFIPQLRLLNSDGTVLAESTPDVFPDTRVLTYATGLAADGTYTLEVTGAQLFANPAENSDEYVLHLERAGTRRASVDENLTPLPDLINMLPPVLEVEEPNADNLLKIPLYGGAVVERPNANTVPNRFTITRNDQQIIVLNANPSPVVSGVQAISFLDTGIGVIARNIQLTRAEFFTDQSFTIAYDSTNRVYVFTLASGQVIITDFYRIDALQAVGGYVTAQFTYTADDDSLLTRRFIVDSQRVELRQRRGLSVNATPINEFRFADDELFASDLRDWDTLAYLGHELRVLFGTDARFVTDEPRIEFRQPDNAPYTITVNPGNAPTTLQLDWETLGDVRIQQNLITILPLDNRVIRGETLASTRSVLIEAGAIRFERTTTERNQFRMILPDGTEIETPADVRRNTTAFPHEPGFAPRNGNNLGTSAELDCPCLNPLATMQPVNPVNGNFQYAVTDIAIPSQHIGLNFTRHYNSLDRGVSIPAYFTSGSQPYFRFGMGWRHSYQYELDLTLAPLDMLTFSLPDGAMHRFAATSAGGERYESRTLLAYIVYREGGLLGTWRAVRGDGMTVYFDRAGRLTRIALTPAQSLTLAHGKTSDGLPVLYIVDEYGRRLEAYSDNRGRITRLRDPLLRDITYMYDPAGALLTGVTYVVPTLQAAYRYNSDEALSTFDDVRSPYVQRGSLLYDERARVSTYTENPENANPRSYSYRYEPRTTQRSVTVSNVERSLTWTLNDRFQIIEYALPRSGISYGYQYDINTDLLIGVRQPTRSTYQLRFDERGNLVNMRDPFFTSEVDSYTFTMTAHGDLTLLTQIEYPGDKAETLEYRFPDNAPPQLVAYTQLIQPISGTQPHQTITTRYEQDERGRVVLIAKPGIDDQATGTVYVYDEFGNVAEIWQGIALAEADNRATLTPDRAARILRFDYDLVGQLRAYSDGQGNLYSLAYDAVTGTLRSITAPQDATITYLYDARNNIIEVNDRGQITHYDYDAFDRLTAITDAHDAVTRYAYDEADNLISLTDALNRQRHYTYDTLDNLTEVTDGDGQTTYYETAIDTTNTRIEQQETRADGVITTWRYDALGRLRGVNINQGGQDYLIDYNRVGMPVSIRENFTGRELALTYDLLGRLTTINNDGSETRFAYDNASNLISVQSPAGHTTRYTYDRLGNILSVIPPVVDDTEAAIQYEYDANNQVISATDATGLTTRYVYDALRQLNSVITAADSMTHYAYDARGNLTRITDPNQNITQQTYDILDRLTTLIDPTGDERLYTYDGVGRLSEILLPEGRTIRYSYDALDRLIGETLTPLQRRTLYSYDAAGNLNSITNPLGHTTTFQHTGFGRIASIADAIGNTETLEWVSGSLRLASYTNKDGRRFQYLLDELGRVESIRDLTNEALAALHTRALYDDDGLLTWLQIATDRARAEDKGDIARSYVYDARGRLIRYIDPTDRAWHFDYDAADRLIGFTDPGGIETRYGYDPAGRITQVIHFADTDVATIARYEYDASGNLRRYISPANIVNTYAYDASNRLTQAVLAAGTGTASTFEFEYNGNGQIVSVTDAEGNTARYVYGLDSLARVEQSLNDASIQYRYSYDMAGELTNAVLPDMPDTDVAEITLTYDALQRRVRYADATRNVWAYTYDRIGNLTQINDPLGSIYRYLYDLNDRVVAIVYPDESRTTLTYDISGHLSQVSLPGTIPTNYTLDAAGNILDIREGNVAVRRYTYDASGRIIRQEKADGSATCYRYDPAGRILETTYYEPFQPCDSPIGRISLLTYMYDPASGNRVSVQREGDEPILYAYDEFNRLIRTTLPDGVTLTYTYDKMGNLLTRTADNFGTTTYTYDERYRPIRIRQDDQEVTLHYDERDQLRQIVRSNNITTAYAYDAAGRVSAVSHRRGDTDILDGFSYQYDAVGNLIGVDRLSDGSRILYSYDVLHRLIEERWLNTTGETVYTLTIRYDAAGNRVAVTHNGQTTQYTYDNHNRLISEARPLITPVAAGLPLGLLFSVMTLRRGRRRWFILIGVLSAGLVGTLVLAQTNPLVTTVLYTYDANGNLTSMGYIEPAGNTLPNVTPAPRHMLNFEYDEIGRLVRVVGQDEFGKLVDTRWSYHDVTHRPTFWRSEEGDRNELFFDGDTLLAMRRTSSELTSIEKYLNLKPNDRLLTIKADGTHLWHLNDAFGAARLFADDEGNIVEGGAFQLDYNSAGMRIYPDMDNRIPADAQLIQLTPLLGGQLYDPSTGFYMLGARVYDPHTARYLQPDPIYQDILGTAYTYAHNRPFMNGTGMQVNPAAPVRPSVANPMPIRPATLLPTMPEPIIPLPDTAMLQREDTFRAWQLLEATRYGVNTTVGELSPLLDTVYILDTPAMPDALKALTAQPTRHAMRLYTSDLGWQPDLTPNAADTINPFLALTEAEPLLVQTAGRLWVGSADAASTWKPLLPTIPVPNAFTPVQQIERLIPALSQDVGIINPRDMETLTQIQLDNLVSAAPQLAHTGVVLPTVNRQPMPAMLLDALRAQQQHLYDLLFD